jgi:excisionase family DNA binding protein
MDTATEQVMTVKEVSEYLRSHPNTVYRFVFQGEMPHFRMGTDIRLLRSDVESLDQPGQPAGTGVESSLTRNQPPAPEALRD